MKNWLKLEEGALFILSIVLFTRLDYAWWWFPLLLFTPDLSMLGYLGGPRLGALTYNIIHNKALSMGIYFIGILMTSQVVQLIGLILFAHSSLDRVLGYGLKFPDKFQHTHLGSLGKSE